jgi:hypothetical protein
MSTPEPPEGAADEDIGKFAGPIHAENMRPAYPPEVMAARAAERAAERARREAEPSE